MKCTKVDIWTLSATSSYFLYVFPLHSCFSNQGVRNRSQFGSINNFSHFETPNSTSWQLCVTICFMSAVDVMYIILKRVGAFNMSVTKSPSVVTQVSVYTFSWTCFEEEKLHRARVLVFTFYGDKRTWQW